MTHSYVQTAPDSSGKKLQTFKNTVGADEVHAEGLVLVDGASVEKGVASNPLVTLDLGTHTNPEQWLQLYHWESEEVEVDAAGVGGEQNLGAAVGVGKVRRIREITIRHAGTNNTVVTVLLSGGATKLTIDVPAQTTRVWGSEDGRSFSAAQQPAVQTSDVTGGSTYVSAAGVEA